MLTPLKSLTLVDQANQQLLHYIDENALVAGDSLPSIAKLSEMMGTSRAVVRESLKSLEAKGIIEVANGRRARIRPVTCEPLLGYFQRFLQMERHAAREFAEVRVALELQSVKLAIEYAQDSELAELRELVQRMREHLHDAETFASLDVRFHLQIARASHNSLLVHLLESLRDAIRESIQRGLQKRLTADQMETVQKFHERVMNSMMERNVDGALAAMNAHFDEIAMCLD